MAKFSAAGIVLEFESKLFGLISSGVKEVRLPLAELLDVKFKKGVLKRGSKIEIRLTSFTKLTELPNKEGKVVLKLFADDFDRAREAVARAQRQDRRCVGQHRRRDDEREDGEGIRLRRHGLFH